jgi:activator of HSP90 ATPase
MKTIRQTVAISAAPLDVYEALMDSRTHARFTGSAARINPQVGGRFETYDGYAEGTNLELVPGRKIVQAWRAGDWPEGHYSTVTFALAKAVDGTTLTFTQRGVPNDQEAAIRQGWIEFYWEPLRRLFATAATRSSPRRGSASSAGRSQGTRRRRRR